MHQTRPLPDTHPEFTVLQWPGFTEYRVEHWRLARNGSNQVVRGTCSWSWLDLIVLIAVGILSTQSVSHPVLLVSTVIALTYLLWSRSTQVLHESLLVFPTLGIQLESHHGHPLFPPLFTTRHFIPLSALEDVVIHEGFRRWNVRFYLAILRRTKASEGKSKGSVRVIVAFENVLPYFPVLKIVYLGVQETLFPPLTRVVQTADEQ